MGDVKLYQKGLSAAEGPLPTARSVRGTSHAGSAFFQGPRDVAIDSNGQLGARYQNTWLPARPAGDQSASRTSPSRAGKFTGPPGFPARPPPGFLYTLASLAGTCTSQPGPVNLATRSPSAPQQAGRPQAAPQEAPVLHTAPASPSSASTHPASRSSASPPSQTQRPDTQAIWSPSGTQTLQPSSFIDSCPTGLAPQTGDKKDSCPRVYSITQAIQALFRERHQKGVVSPNTCSPKEIENTSHLLFQGLHSKAAWVSWCYFVIFVFSLVFSFLVVDAGAIQEPSITVKAMPDGVAISAAEDLRQIVASWDIFVTLQPPSPPTDLQSRLMDLEGTFRAIMSLDKVGINVDLMPFEIRVNRLKQVLDMVPVTDKTSRSKRGAVNILGTVAHHLFGLATDAQLRRYKSALDEVKGRQKDLMHAQVSLASVVNQTHVYLQQLLVQQQHLREQLLKLDTAVLTLGHSVQSNTKKLNMLNLVTSLDRYLDILTLAADHYQDQKHLFHQQRAGLEQGQLTRTLLTEVQLKEILDRAALQHSVITQVAWYYSSLAVTPIWRDTESLVYRIELPLISDRPYLSYEFAAFPVPLNNSTFQVTLQLEPMYAVGTVSGSIVAPYKCVGRNPRVCLTGAEYDSSKLQCARGLITNRPKLVQQCKVTVQDLGTGPIINTINLNQYAFATHGDTLEVRCPGEPSKQITLESGSYNISCIRPCTLAGKGFIINCVDRLYLARNYAFKAVLATALLNFTKALNFADVQTVLPQIESSLAPMPDVSVHSLFNPMPMIQFSDPPIRHNPSILTVINIGCLGFVLAALSAWYLRRRFRSRKGAATLHPNLDHRVEMLPLAAADGETAAQEAASAPNSHQVASPNARIWPVLPPVFNCTSAPPEP